MAADNIRIIQEIIDLIQKAKGELDGVNASVVAISKNARQAKDSFNLTSPKKVNEEIKKNTQYNDQLAAQLKEQKRLEEALIKQMAKKMVALESTNKELQKQRLETQIINKEYKDNARITSELTTEYEKQSAILNKLRKEYKDLAIQQELGNKLSSDQVKEMKRLEGETIVTGKL